MNILNKNSKKYKPKFQISSKKVYKDNGIMIFRNAAEVAGKFIPPIDAALKVANIIIEIYDQAKYNKEICRIMVDRVELAMTSIKLLKRHINDDDERFKEKKYYEAFIHFNEILENIKSFVEDVSTMNKFMGIWNSKQIKEQIEVIRDDFDHAYNALHLVISIDQVINRENEDKVIKNELHELKEYCQNIHKGMSENYNLITTVLAAKVENLEKNSAKDSLFDNIKPPQLDSKDIRPHESTEYRGRVKLMKYKTLDVACKMIKSSIDKDTPESKRIRGTLIIWSQLHECPHIIGFLGISKLDVGNCMIFEWAELGNLRGIYEKKKLSWQTKLYIARDVSRGLGFLHVIGILHHNVKAENILVTDSRYKCKISNFDLSRGAKDESHELTDLIEVIHWMAPEKLKSHYTNDYVPYTYKCEMFSFGMFLWELSFNRIPYKNFEPNEIMDHVISGKRETLDYENGPSDIIEAFNNIITLAWQQDSRIRPEDPVVSNILESLAKTYSSLEEQHKNDSAATSLEISQTSSDIENDNDADENSDLVLDDDEDDDDEFELLPLKKGIEIHKLKPKDLKTKEDYELPWKCFNAHAAFGNKTAIYWKAYYLWEGYYVEKDRKEAVRLFKIAADAGNSDAQLRYAFAFIKNPDLPFDKDTFLKYLTKSAENGNATALFNLGDAYYNGKRKVPVNKEKGIEYLKIAALKNYSNAINALNNYGISL
ncbi:kinase-like domain-containing protein [Glomus cerebriforme]|uniref:Kinase-like domain-containing protein n=1 Tax=Glomus cerebriforme TaxID=658196 RepID=A0A397TWC2_9GLOM|nr:kinase-like domain-containing protein [Glomus cerebriforme]